MIKLCFQRFQKHTLFEELQILDKLWITDVQKDNCLFYIVKPFRHINMYKHMHKLLQHKKLQKNSSFFSKLFSKQLILQNNSKFTLFVRSIALK